LGNVLAVVSDKKEFVGSSWRAYVLSAQDYYPFGMSMPGRKHNGGTYRYGFNGKETDSETGLNDFGARFYAPNIGRWLSVDPLAHEFAAWSPYVGMNNNPMFFIDPTGMSADSHEATDNNDPPHINYAARFEGDDFYTVDAQFSEADAPVITEARLEKFKPQPVPVRPNPIPEMYATRLNFWDNLQITLETTPISGAKGGLIGLNMLDELSMFGQMWNPAHKGPVTHLNGSLATYDEKQSAGVNGLMTVMPGVGAATAMGRTEAVMAANTRKMQLHHFATNKHSSWTAKFEGITSRYGLDLNGDWNKMMLPHSGRHPNVYHEFVYDGMSRAANEAGGNVTKFLELYNQYVKTPVIQNPDILYLKGWR
jgi:RHS repeat-associated protein